MFLTEGNYGGGWWWSTIADKDGEQQTEEEQLLDQMLAPLDVLIKPATTSRIFGVACGMNLRAPDTVQRVHQYLDRLVFNPIIIVIFSKICRNLWNSILLPTASSLLPGDYACVLPELFVELYYFASPFRSSVLRVWAKSAVTRIHTGLLIMERSDRLTEGLHVSRFEHAPTNTRPIGVDLPDVTSLCACSKLGNNDAKWKCHHSSDAYGEGFYFFRSSCCRLELHVAIYKDRRCIRRAHDIIFVEEEWDWDLQRFTFDSSDMVCMKASVGFWRASFITWRS